MRRFTLSVAMPNYNHAKYLPRAIEGIVEQSRPPDEFLILDDASTDHSVEIIRAYAQRYPSIRFVRNEHNAGVIAAHQRLYEMATGDYLYSAAADDERYPWFFEQAMEMAQRFPHAGLVFGVMVMIDEEGRELGEIRVRRWREPLYASPERFLREYLEVEPAAQSAAAATIFRRDAFQEVGWCRPELGSFADTFALRAIALRHGACYVPERFAAWRRVPQSFSHQSASDARHALDVVARAARLMRSPEFAGRFPPDYVARWRRRQKWQTIWNTFLGEAAGPAAERSRFWARNLRRLKRVPGCVPLVLYQGRP